MENAIRELLEANIEELDKLYKFLELANLLNEQYVLDWKLKLQEISLKNAKTFSIKDLPSEAGIYYLRNNYNGKMYIGKSNNIKRRIREHIYSKDDLYIHRALRKYGIDNFTIGILELCSKENLNEREIFYINKYKTLQKGYNLTSGGEGLGNYVLSERHKNILKNIQSKKTYAYNLSTNEIINCNSAKELSELLNIKVNNIYDAIHNKSYSHNYTFGYSEEDVINNSKNIKIKNPKSIYLYNTKTKERLPIFNSISEAENYLINNGITLSKGHLYTAINKNNKHIKGFLFANSEEELNEKIKNYSEYIYCYNLEDGKFFMISGTNKKVLDELNSYGYNLNSTTFNQVLNNKLKQHKGFIVDRNLKNLITKILNYNKIETTNISNIIKSFNLSNEQEILNWADSLNAISVEI